MQPKPVGELEIDLVKEARGKVLAIGVSATVSIIYSVASLNLVHGYPSLPGSFWVVVFIALSIFLIGAINWQEIPDQIRWYDQGLSKKGVGACVYLLTGFYILILCWICYETGGPARSPYSVILLTVAVLSPFVTRPKSYFPMIAVLVFVSVAYVLTTVLYDWHGPKVREAPELLVAITSLVSVVISIVLEVLRRNALERGHDAPSDDSNPTTSA